MTTITLYSFLLLISTNKDSPALQSKGKARSDVLCNSFASTSTKARVTPGLCKRKRNPQQSSSQVSEILTVTTVNFTSSNRVGRNLNYKLVRLISYSFAGLSRTTNCIASDREQNE